jgi:NAD(P)H-dependent FMN reductase
MKKIIAFAGSNNSSSINHALVAHVASTIENCDVTLLKLTEFPLPIYSEDLEKNQDFPEGLKNLLTIIKEADGLLISVNEHNGSLSAFFKNCLDWLTRIDSGFLKEKKVVLLSTSPGKRGGLSALEYIASFLPRIKAEVIDAISFPSFYENFSIEENKITDTEQAENIQKAVNAMIDSLK